MGNHYWNHNTQMALETWYYCQSASTSATTRAYIYSHILYGAFDVLISKLQTTLSISQRIITKEDLQQVIHIYIWEKLMHKLKPELIQAALQFFYISSYNYVWNLYIVKKHIKYESLEGDNEDGYNPIVYTMCATSEYDADAAIKQIDNQILIQNAIDAKIANNNTYTTNCMYLEYLKRYLIANDYNAEGFDMYIMQKMNISKENFALINSKLHINTKVLRTQKIKKQYQ
jgi:hypothetical protein